MRPQVAGLNKALATHHANMGFLARVGPGMPRQVTSPSKALATRHANRGFLARVGPGMPRQVAGVSKALATRHANMGFSHVSFLSQSILNNKNGES